MQLPSRCLLTALQYAYGAVMYRRHLKPALMTVVDCWQILMYYQVSSILR
jgi:hypothetical protein